MEEEVMKAQYNYNCHAQGFLGVALKSVNSPSPSKDHISHPKKKRIQIYIQKKARLNS